MNVFTEISTRELENTLKGKAVRYIVNDAGEGLCLFFEGWTDNTGSNHGDAIHISPVIDAAGKPQLVVQYVPEEERPEDSETCNNGSTETINKALYEYIAYRDEALLQYAGYGNLCNSQQHSSRKKFRFFTFDITYLFQ